MPLVIRNAGQLVPVAPVAPPAAGNRQRDNLGIIDKGAVIIREGRIDWIGPCEQLPLLPPDAPVIDASGQTIIPGFVDSYTQLIFAGTIEEEFEQRLQGLS